MKGYCILAMANAEQATRWQAIEAVDISRRPLYPGHATYCITGIYGGQESTGGG